jgi:UDP-N-acetylmuramyl pentapeptide phosphotransferase/UDP-N-acetylglucosamine-1-phosphate transferase
MCLLDVCQIKTGGVMAINKNVNGVESVFPPEVMLPLLETFSLALLVSLFICMLNILTERWHGRFSFDIDVNGVQKVHKNMVSRTGGVAMVAGVLAVPSYGALVGYPLALQTETNALILLLLLAALPAFLAGIIEDLTKQVSVRLRLCAILTSGVLAA